MKKYITVLAFIVLAMPMFTFAASCGSSPLPPCSPIGTAPSPTDTNLIGSGSYDSTGTWKAATPDTVIASLVGLVNWFAWFIGLIAVVMGLYAGFLFITGGDNTTQIASARKIMLYAIIGIAVAIVAFGLIAVTRSVLAL